MIGSYLERKKMKVETYFLSDKVVLDTKDLPELLFEIMYQTILPIIGTWALLTTHYPLFWIFLIVPIFFKIRLRRKRIGKPKYKKQG